VCRLQIWSINKGLDMKNYILYKWGKSAPCASLISCEATQLLWKAAGLGAKDARDAMA
jgi:hypothetical protein